MSELILERRLAQGPEQVFEAFESPFALRRWYGAPRGCHRTGAEGQVAPGESFRVNLVDARGVPFAQRGQLLEVVPGGGLVLEMSWEGGGMSPETTRASIVLSPDGGGTRIEVRQGPFSSHESLEAHRDYWEVSLERLARVVAGEPVPCFEEFWDESNGFSGPLGLAAYGVLAGLREAGATPEVLAQVEETLYAHLGRLSPQTADVLGAVLRSRLNEV
jgi:uncharacterized protein YndB with AHSA1/START domain